MHPHLKTLGAGHSNGGHVVVRPKGSSQLGGTRFRLRVEVHIPRCARGGELQQAAVSPIGARIHDD